MVPMVLDWGIGDNKTCEEAKKNQTSYACGQNTTCYDAEDGNGYICKCSEGYEGNAYLSDGCKGSIPIIHKDVKSTNILLDDNYTTKVSDFGASGLVPLVQDQLAMVVQGTLGYLGPEYMLTNQLIEKSDVYSFGVVLVELITRKKVLSFDKPEKERSLARYFLLCMQNDQLFQVIDEQIEIEGIVEELTKVANIAKRCLIVKGEERPTMKEVAMELERLIIKKMKKHPWVKIDFNGEESEHLLHRKLSGYEFGGCITSSSNTIATGYDSVQDSFPFSIGFSSDEGSIFTPSDGELFAKGHSFPSVKILTLHRSNTFHLEAFNSDPNELPPGTSPKISMT
ncbi:putative wall-associated receptor kinase-like 16 [Camellia lanceoleosa]|uniref:Wall-associated receptor kinase-like 16 n=1 Tax=Camellia lanceoleosa TaxID=1840588 RepID=A0ACC0HLA3_9ERIC|nr:putative wall-associated receptor kinase-like 16 [Camellia lanceoleosa]